MTWDGAFLSGVGELCLVTGDPPRPVTARVKQLGYGHLPIVHFAWQEGEVRYSASAFAAMVAVGAAREPVTFVRLEMRRMASKREPERARPAILGCAIRQSGLDHRAPALSPKPPNAAARYEFAEGCAVVDGAAVCLLPTPAPAKRYAVLGAPYAGAFTADQVGLKPPTAALIATWELGSGAELSLDLKLPWTPIPLQSADRLGALRSADYDYYMKALAEEWIAKLATGMDLSFPEEKPLSAYAANVVYALLAIETGPGGATRPVHRLGTAPLSGTESAAIVRALDVAGQAAWARECSRGLLQQQQSDGCLSATGDRREHAGILLAAVRHCRINRDRAWADAVYPALSRAADWLAEAVLAPATPDAATRFAVAAAFGGVADVAASLDRTADAQRIRAALDRYAASLPTGPPALSADTAAPLLAAAEGGTPSPALPPEDASVTALCRSLRESQAEGLLVEGGVLAPAATAALARLHAARGEQEQAIGGLYALALHTGSCHEGFAAGAHPWSDRDSGEDYPPDPRFAAAYVTLVRELFVREEGETLHLLSALSPAWVISGKPVGVKGAPTAFGQVSVVLTPSDKGAEVEIAGDWTTRPERLILHLPYFAEVSRIEADQPGLRQGEGPAPAAGGANRWIELRPTTTRVSLTWRPRTAAPLSYESTLEAWQTRYRAAYDEHRASGGRPAPMDPPPLR